MRPVRNHNKPVFVGCHDTVLQFGLALRVFDKKSNAMFLEMLPLRYVLLGRLIGKKAACPNLAVRVRVRTSHDLTLVLEHLDPAVSPAKFKGLLSPDINHPADVFNRHFRQGEVMPRREADDTALAHYILGSDQGMGGGCSTVIVRQERGKVICENKRVLVIGIDPAPGARVARAEVTAGVVARKVYLWKGLDLSQPGPLSAMRRNQDPIAGERVVTAVGAIHPA
jgi:hypothetical protein